MSISKWYEIICDYCGNAQHFSGTVRIAELSFRDYGGIVTKDKKHYCDEDCQKKAELNHANKSS